MELIQVQTFDILCAELRSAACSPRRSYTESVHSSSADAQKLRAVPTEAGPGNLLKSLAF